MSALLHAKNIGLTRGTKSLFEQLNLVVNYGQKIGLVGHNGSGKSSLLSVLNGSVVPDDGEVIARRGLQIGLVEQFVPSDLRAASLFDSVARVLDREQRLTDGFKVETILHALGFTARQFSQQLQHLSGGQQNLALIARAQMQQPQILLMDEPGNHMDMQALGHLRGYLCSTAGITFVMISHDRELLDDCCNQTVFLRDQKTYAFNLPYTQAQSALQTQDEQARHRLEAQEKEIDRIRVSAKRLAQWGHNYDNEDLARKAKTMALRADKLDATKTEVTKGSGLSLQLSTQQLRSKAVVTLEKLVVRAQDDQRILAECDYLVLKPGDRVGLLGLNGTGKSTTIRRILAALPGNDEQLRFNPKVSVGYFDQELVGFEQKLGRYDWLAKHVDAGADEVKRMLIAAGVAYEDFSRHVNTLSGGERARLVFMLLALKKPNFMILDEPTNHIDLDSREQLETQLMDSNASMLITSHDRRFLQTVCTRYWLIEDAQLLETNDPDKYYAQFDAFGVTDDLGEQSSAVQTGQVGSVDSVDEMLTRVQELEDLLLADEARKLKFQKPKLQAQWREELRQLWHRLG